MGVTGKKKQEERWNELFRQVLNRPSPEQRAVIPEATEDLDINTNLPTTEKNNRRNQGP
jgi:hypothetical protein